MPGGGYHRGGGFFSLFLFCGCAILLHIALDIYMGILNAVLDFT